MIRMCLSLFLFCSVSFASDYEESFSFGPKWFSYERDFYYFFQNILNASSDIDHELIKKEFLENLLNKGFSQKEIEEAFIYQHSDQPDFSKLYEKQWDLDPMFPSKESLISYIESFFSKKSQNFNVIMVKIDDFYKELGSIIEKSKKENKRMMINMIKKNKIFQKIMI